MARRNRSEELDGLVEAVLRGEAAGAGAGTSSEDAGPGAGRDASAPADAELAALVGIAEALRGLPRQSFRDGLAAALERPIGPQDLREAARDLPAGELRRLGSFGNATIGLFRFSGQGPWERHPGGDELIVVLDGGGEITVLSEAGPVVAELRPGRLFVCPRGLWHRPVATPSMTALYVTPLEGGEHSWADDPRAA